VRCVAIPVKAADVRMALSMSGPDARMSSELAARAIPRLTEASRQSRKTQDG
jgi:DNA-binding IclR family transcriptional regulator